MRHAALIAILLWAPLAIPQGRNVHADRMCALQGGVSPKQIVDSVFNLKILLVQFTDVRCRMDADATSPRYTCADFEDLLGSEGVYVSPAMHSPDGDEVFGSMNDYFINMSGGRMRIHAFVVNRRDSLSGKPVWITLGQTKQYYQETTVDFFYDSFDLAIALGLDVARSENTMLAVIYAGNTYFLNGGLNPRAWGLNYVMSEVQGKRYNQELPGARFSRIGIHCHEFAHTLGIGHSTGGRADLMYGGTSNGSVDGNAPAPLNAIVRARLGWAGVISAGSMDRQEVDLPYSLGKPTVYVMENSVGDQFYVENRRFDQTMTIGATVVPDYNNVMFFPPAGPHHAITQGIFVWRVTTDGDLADPGYSSEGLVYASGRYGRTYPENEVSDTDDGVPFPGVSNNTLLTPWSDPRNPYIRESDFFTPGLFHYTLYVPNTKGGANCGMEVLSGDRAAGTFRVRFYSSNPPNPALALLPVPDSVGFYESRRTVIRRDSGSIHQAAELGGEIFYRRSTDGGRSWSPASPVSSGLGGNSAPCMARAGTALLMTWQTDASDVADTGRSIILVRSTDAGKSWCDTLNLGWSSHCAPPGAEPFLAGANDGSAILVYRAERSSLVSTYSSDAGITWSPQRAVLSGCNPLIDPSVLLAKPMNGGVEEEIAYCSDSSGGSPTVYVECCPFAMEMSGHSVNFSRTIPSGYVSFSRPAFIAACPGGTRPTRVLWDAIDLFESNSRAIVLRGMYASSPGNSSTILKGSWQDDLSLKCMEDVLAGKLRWRYQSRVLNLLDTTGGSEVSIEVGGIGLRHRDGSIDSLNLVDPPADTARLDEAALLNSGRSGAFILGPGADTLIVVFGVYGKSPSSLFTASQGHVGIQIVCGQGDTVIATLFSQSAATFGDYERNLTRLALPVGPLAQLWAKQPVSFRINTDGLRSDIPLTPGLCHMYSNLAQDPVLFSVTEVAGGRHDGTPPPTYSLAQNYPNPFNPSTIIRYSLPHAIPVSLAVYDLLGKKVTTLVEGSQNAGTHEIQFNAGTLASGVYMYRLTAGSFVSVKRALLVR